MSDDEQNEKMVLAGDEAIALWQQGRDEWNAWIAEHPVANASFEGVDFSKYRTEQFPAIVFDGFRFAACFVSFDSAGFDSRLMSS